MTARPLQQGDYVQINRPGDDYDKAFGHVTSVAPDGWMWVTPDWPEGSLQRTWSGSVPKRFRPRELWRVMNPPAPSTDSKDPE